MSFDFLNTYEFWIMQLLIVVAVYLYHGIRALSVGLDQIAKSISVLEKRQKRLSATYMKIENDLVTLQKTIARTARQDQNTQTEIQKIWAGGEKRLAWLFENGPSAIDQVRGLEFPDVDEDPFFAWYLRPETHASHLDFDENDADIDEKALNGEDSK